MKRILLIEDEADDAMMIVRKLSDCHVLVASSFSMAVSMLSRNTIDLVICDYHLPDQTSDGASLDVFRSEVGAIPVVVVSGGDPDCDYVAKGDWPELIRRVENRREENV